MENYSRVIKKCGGGGLTPAGGECEATCDKAEPDDHIPSPDVRDWVAGVADIVNNDPDQANQEAGQHRRSEPLWALLWKRGVVRDLIWDIERILLTALGLRHKEKVHHS